MKCPASLLWHLVNSTTTRGGPRPSRAFKVYSQRPARFIEIESNRRLMSALGHKRTFRGAIHVRFYNQKRTFRNG